MIVTAKKGRLTWLIAGTLTVVLSYAPSDRALAGIGALLATGSPTCGLKFEPGPVVDGRHRQPTPGEFESRMQALREACQTVVGACSSSPSGRATGDLTVGTSSAASPRAENR